MIFTCRSAWGMNIDRKAGSSILVHLQVAFGARAPASTACKRNRRPSVDLALEHRVRNVGLHMLDDLVDELLLEFAVGAPAARFKQILSVSSFSASSVSNSDTSFANSSSSAGRTVSFTSCTLHLNTAFLTGRAPLRGSPAGR
jgi:hypothetical protein